MSTLEAILSRVKPSNLFAAGILSEHMGSSYLETPRDHAPATSKVESSCPVTPRISSLAGFLTTFETSDPSTSGQENEEGQAPSVRSSAKLLGDDACLGVMPEREAGKSQRYDKGKALWAMVREKRGQGELRLGVALLQVLDQVHHQEDRDKSGQDEAAARAEEELQDLRIKAAKYGDLTLLRQQLPHPPPSGSAGRSWEWWEEPYTLEETSPRSLLVLGRDSAVRRACWAVYKSNAARAFSIFVLVANNLFISLVPDVVSGKTLKGGVAATQPKEPPSALDDALAWADTFDVACMIFLALEILNGSAACGLASRKHISWLSASAVNPVDLLVLVSAVAEYGLLVFGYKPLMLRSLRLLRLFRLFDQVPVLRHMTAMVSTLQKGASQLLSVWFVFLSFVVSFGIFGMELFSGSFSMSCKLEGSEVVMGGYPFRLPCSAYSETDNVRSPQAYIIPRDFSQRLWSCMPHAYRPLPFSPSLRLPPTSE